MAYARTILTALLVLGAATAAMEATQSAANYVIGPQDVLAIQIYDQPEIGGKYTVEADGTFTFPLIGRIKAGGLTLRGFETELKKRLADGYFRNPQVSVGVEHYRSQRIFVLGEVRNAGPVPLTGGMTLIEALARAGSALPSASGEILVVRGSDIAPAGVASGQPSTSELTARLTTGVEIFRAFVRDMEAGKLRQNIELQDGDILFVPRAETVYVFGQVKNPNIYPIQKDTTVLQALSLAGGHTEHAALNRIDIVRIVNGERKKIRVKLTDIVQPGDTIMVPERYF